MKYLYNPATNSFEPMEPNMRERFALGGSIETPKRGLVDGPGSYSGNPYANSPKFKKFLKEYGNYNRIADVVRAYERKLSTEGKVVGIKKLHEALGPNNPYTFETFNNIFSRADKKITKNMSNVEKNYIKAGQRLKKIIIDNIGEPELLGDIQKKYKNIRTTGTSTDKVFTLNKNKIESLNNALNKNYNVMGFRENTIDNVFKLINDKDFMKSLKAYKGGKIDEKSPLFKKLFKAGSGDMPYAYMTLGRVLRGEIVMEGIKKNKVLGDKIIKSISGDFEGPMGTAAKRWAKFQMAKHFNDPKASYYTITQTIKNAFENAGVKNIDIDEIFPARTGQITIGKGSGAYNQIVQFIDADINRNAKRAFDGRASKRYQLIIDAYKNKNFDKVKQLVDSHQADINNFYKKNPEAKGKVKLTQLNYNPKTRKFASPTEIYGKDVLPSKIQKDIDKFYQKTGLSLDVGSTTTLEKAAAEMKKNPTKSNVKAKIKQYAAQGRNTIQKFYSKLPGKTLRMVPGAAAAAIDYGVFAGLLGTPVDEAIIGASGWLTKKPELGKALGTIATQYSEGKITFAELREKSLPILKEIAKEQLPESKLPPVAEEINEKMGEGTIKIADEVPQPESAERRKMFEDFNERFGDTNELEISDVDDQFMAAMGGRVGFADGTVDNSFINQSLAALESSNVAEQFIKDNTPSLKDEVYGEDGERNLIQTFNTMFADPKAYPYYAQELASGGANILELAGRFPFAVLGLVSDLATGRGDKLKRFGETLDPKLTKFIKEKIGFTDMLEKSRAKRTSPQQTLGSILELGAEIPGPATPYFLIKTFPKIVKEIKDLTGSAVALDKVNKEIERKASQEGVDQVRRDILLATGAGGAVALLKFLGLDKLIKTTKVAKAAPEIVTKGGTPKYFFDFVSLIKSKGKNVTDKASTIEREKVFDYKGYTLSENMDTGKIEIRKNTEGGAQFTTPDGETDTYETLIEELIQYKPPEIVVGKDGKPVRTIDEYEEMTAGRSEDPEFGLDSIDDILESLAENGYKYSIDELARMGFDYRRFRPEDLKRILKDPAELDVIKAKEGVKETIEKAGGGIVKLAGVDSGPPPKSGPTSHGLPYVAKNVRPIKERK